MHYSQAMPIAQTILEKLSKSCQKIEIAGSIRRKRSEVGDIEICAIPIVHAGGLFGDFILRDTDFINTVTSLGRIVKGHPETGKYIQIELLERIKLDLFVARPENWGLIFAIRTGSANYSHDVLAKGWKRCGYTSINGMLTKGGRQVPVTNEKILFELIGLPWLDPIHRNF